ncbi:hypothetical protein HFN20_19685 [Paenibacillus dendritiformis]|uniref:S41 family peptidase n=1 Tax=Paenibacillus dendritiformis TaxID=130049 RepID=UPI00143D16A1|nr:S41 family peptidase [Paenibacillus dendritiformis]NKI23425.1 hypothetical protein [Paenibacillus dendritiformis]NRG01245.1 hypothetical protein [Paenibacillus dendritiformis]
MNKSWLIPAAVLLLLLGLAACDAKEAPSGTGGSISVQAEPKQAENPPPADGGGKILEPGKLTLTEEQKREDFEAMVRIVKDNYPFLQVNQRVHHVDWLKNADLYEQFVLQATTDDEFRDRMNTVLRDLNNGHTSFLDKSFYAYMKRLYRDMKEREQWHRQLSQPHVEARYFADGEDMDSALSPSSAASPVTGILKEGKLAYLSIPSLPHERVEEDNAMLAPFLEKIRSYDALIIDIRGNGGGSTSYWGMLVPQLMTEPLTSVSYFLFRKGELAQQYAHSAYSPEQLLPVAQLKEELGAAQLPPEIETDFQNYIKNEITFSPEAGKEYRGRIYLLVDGGVYSSAEAWAVFAKSTGWATLVGERTGGDGIGIDPMIATLPQSGFAFRMPSVMGLTSSGVINEERKTEPDIEVSAVKTGNLWGDPAVHAVILEEKKRSGREGE